MAVQAQTGRPVDRRVYEDELSEWLPSKIFDCHVHVSVPRDHEVFSEARYRELWPLEIGICQTWRQKRLNHQLLFPGQEVVSLVFGEVLREFDIDAENQYVFQGISDPEQNAYGLYVMRPEWDASKLKEAMAKGFLGMKPYPDLAPQRTQEVSIFDFAPKTHLAALDEAGGVLMLHLPRAGRLADPDNISELLEISDRYPRIKLIVAHVGRAYCLPNAERGLPHLANREGIYFDITANLNAEVLQYALEMVGPDRLLFGSDLPLLMMRGVREHVGEEYINYTDGLYTWNTRRKSPEEEADYTFYVYEELRSLIKACERSGCGVQAFEKILYSNCAALLGKCETVRESATADITGRL
ncbi:MAG: amidohydrolase [Armatimonadetes bacterium]|nr:amidohydrolase [Armatimonadota bacterium]